MGVDAHGCHSAAHVATWTLHYKSTVRVSLRKYFIPGCVGRGLDLDLRIRPAAASGPKWVGPSWAHVGGPKLGPSGWAQGGPKLGPSWSKIWIFSNTIFLRVFEKIEPDKWGHFQNTIFLRAFEKWDPDIFQKSEMFKISCSSHSKNAHIKLNLDS